MAIRDRIKELRRVKASEIIPNPKNWRIHPNSQREAISGILEDIGYADALIAYEGENGLTLIDGHLRAETTPDEDVPVLVLDVSEDEADIILATLDPVAGMAEANQSALSDLLDRVFSEDSRVSAILEQIGMGMTPGFEPVGAWSPDIENTDSIVPTSEPIQSTVEIKCPIQLEDEIRGVVTETLKGYDSVTIQ